VVPLTATNVEREELLGAPVRGQQQRPPTTDATATRVLTKGEPIPGATGRADDFSWPRGSTVNAEPAAAEPAATPAPATATAPAGAKPKPATTAAPAGQRPATDAQGEANPPGEPKPPVQRRARTNSDAPRPPLSIQNFFR
jgi:hypothetical protein